MRKFSTPLVLFFVLSTLFIFILTSCKKEVAEKQKTCQADTLTVTVIDTVYQDTTFTGLYVGTYASDNNPEVGNSFTSFIFYPDNSLLHKNISTGVTYYDSGTWSKNGNIVTCRMTSMNVPYLITQVDTFTYDKATNTLNSGIWVHTSGDFYTGTFSTLTKNK